METNVTIKNATLDNLQEIAEVSVLCWRESYKDIIEKKYLDNLSIEEKFIEISTRFDQSKGYTIIALVGNKIVGFCDFNKSSFPELSKGEIYTLYVIEKYQGCGIGKNLVKKAAEQLQIKDLIPFIAVAFEKNEKAAMFYKKLGFKNIRSIDSKIDNKLYKEIIYLNNLDENLI